MYNNYVPETEMVSGRVEQRLDNHQYDEVEYKYPYANVVRHGLNHLMQANQIVIGDIVRVSKDISSVTPCDMIILETSGQFTVSSYLEIMDKPHLDMFEYRTLGEELPPGACIKRGGFGLLGKSAKIKKNEFKNLILNSPNFVPMGVQILQGEAKGICIKLGN